VIADSGFSSRAIYAPEVAPPVAWGKPAARTQGAHIASADLWHGLVEPAIAWITEVHPHSRHLLRTHRLGLGARPTGRRRASDRRGHPRCRARVPARRGRPSGVDGPISPVYERWHQDRSARIVGEWLLAHGAEPDFALEVVSLVSVHEERGLAEAELLQAADSLSFLEVQVEFFAGLVARGEWSEQAAVAKLGGCMSGSRCRRLASSPRRC